MKFSHGRGSAKIQAKFVTIDIESPYGEISYEALSYSWGGHLMLCRVITLNNRSYLVADAWQGALPSDWLERLEQWLSSIGTVTTRKRELTRECDIEAQAHSVMVGSGISSSE